MRKVSCNLALWNATANGGDTGGYIWFGASGGSMAANWIRRDREWRRRWRVHRLARQAATVTTDHRATWNSAASTQLQTAASSEAILCPSRDSGGMRSTSGDAELPRERRDLSDDLVAGRLLRRRGRRLCCGPPIRSFARGRRYRCVRSHSRDDRRHSAWAQRRRRYFGGRHIRGRRQQRRTRHSTMAPVARSVRT